MKKTLLPFLFAVAASTSHAGNLVTAGQVKRMTCIGQSEEGGSVSVLNFKVTSPKELLRKNPDLKKSELWDAFSKSEAVFSVEETEMLADYGATTYEQLFSMTTGKGQGNTLDFAFIADWKASGSVVVKKDENGNLGAEGKIDQKGHLSSLKCSVSK